MTDREIKLEQICTEPDLSKELKEKGFPQNTLFYWNYPEVFGDDAEDDALVENPDYFDEAHLSMSKNEDSISAPTASDIFEELPVLISVNKTFHGWFTCSMHENCPLYGKISHEEIIDDDGHKDWFTLQSTGGATAAEAAAKMWLYLKSNKLLNLKKDK